jgi:hypothetical protein
MNWQVFPVINWALGAVWSKLFVAANGYSLTEATEFDDQCMSIQHVCQQSVVPSWARPTHEANASQDPGDQSGDCPRPTHRWQEPFGRRFGRGEPSERAHSTRHLAAGPGAEPPRTQEVATARCSDSPISPSDRTRIGLRQSLDGLVAVGASDHRLGSGSGCPRAADCGALGFPPKVGHFLGAF